MIKRLIDIGVAVALLFLLCPFFLLIAILVHIKLGSPILFRQQRPGLHGTPFRLYKFRTMRNATEAELAELVESDKTRITRLGGFLRSTSLDELPSLFNVLKGDMSLVGPRPLLMSYLSRYTPTQARRHEVKPGITGYAQVNGRNALSWEEKFHLDVLYVDNQSLKLDLKILLLTIKKVAIRDGISAEGKVTTSEFMGSEEKLDC